MEDGEGTEGMPWKKWKPGRNAMEEMETRKVEHGRNEIK
jgi:hypothetical protein